ncbi:hypothetical protein TanjilG_11645 [Lupinus angustifolius]|uniref:BHLH domain-containing protein n=1 Tax=Lupinus angustifolius TaxID=3871 RepID=A0A1J7GZP6_LUPAN|nr:PREDICTED: transcription factor bHLH123-like isoform X2 [Lupinus angustifolius]OIW05958.1 hypothetical protein TanjilG_11645 [Lupinus angustifolius]
MADDNQFQGSGNWWESSRNMRFESGDQSQSSSSGLTNIGNFCWQQQQHDMVVDHMKPRSSSSMEGTTSVQVFHDKLQQQQQDSCATNSTNDHNNLHMMGLGLSSQAMDWNQASLLRGEKASESSFRSMLQENLSSSNTNFQHETGIGLSQQVQWRPEPSSTNEFKQVNRGFSLDQTQFSPQYSSGDSNVTSQGIPSTFHTDHYPSVLQGLLGPESNQQGSFENIRPMSFPYSPSYGLNSNELIPSWPGSKVPQFLRASPPKQPPIPNSNQLHFTNNAPFWNASEAPIKDARPSFFPSLQQPFSTPSFDVQSKNISEVRDSGAVMKKSGSEPPPKRPRNETPSPLPAFKVRKEKMGDRITALQQLVAPFGKTDTASVLSEAIEYIKFLHEQVTVLSTPYMKSGAPTLHQQNSGNSKEGEGPKQDLRSRGLCLVPVSSTFPVTHEPTVDFWTPTFGGTYR